MKREDVYRAIDTERDHQDRKWGTVKEHPHEVGAWLTLLRSLLTRAESAWSGSPDDRLALSELQQLLAVGVACCEQHGVETRSKHSHPPVESMRSNERLLHGE
jgi:hypothetical protein